MIQNGTISTAGDDFALVPGGLRYSTTAISICNSGTTSRTFDMHIVKSGDSPSASNRVLVNRTLNGYDSFWISDKWILDSGDKLRFVASSNGVLNAVVSTIAL
jgi:hypothetical protein